MVVRDVMVLSLPSEIISRRLHHRVQRHDWYLPALSNFLIRQVLARTFMSLLLWYRKLYSDVDLKVGWHHIETIFVNNPG